MLTKNKTLKTRVNYESNSFFVIISVTKCQNGSKIKLECFTGPGEKENEYVATNLSPTGMDLFVEGLNRIIGEGVVQHFRKWAIKNRFSPLDYQW